MDSERISSRTFAWIVGGRLLLVFALSGGAYALSPGLSGTFDAWRLSLVLAGVIIASLVSVVWRLLGVFEKGLVRTQTVLDVMIVGLAVYWSGGIASPFAFLYPAVILAACLLDGRRGGTLASILATAGYAIACWAAHVGGIPIKEVFLTFFVNMAAFAATASLGILLARHLFQAKSSLAEARDNLRRIEELHRHLADSMRSGLVTVDRSGIVMSCNQAAIRILGKPMDFVTGRAIDEIWPEAGVLAGHLAREEDVDRTEIRYQAEDGASKCLGVSAFPLRNEENGVLGHGIIFQDITQIKADEERRERLDRLAALGEMAAGLAHEIRNPLASISGATQLLAESGMVHPSGEKLLGIISRECGRLSDLTQYFLLYAMPEIRSRERFGLRILAEEVISEMEGIETRPTVTNEIPPDLWFHGDRARFAQVLRNILLNARQALPESGGKIVISARDEGERLQVAIEDNGCGIREEDLSRVFNPFYTTRPEAMGLGLSIAHQIVKASGGEIAIHPRHPENGTRCTITFPAGSLARQEDRPDTSAGACAGSLISGPC